MALVKVPKPRPVITDTMTGLEILIPAKRNYFMLAFISLWLVGWAFGWESAFQQLTSRRNPGGFDLFLLVWITVWTLGGGFCLFIVAWSLAGRERVILGPSLLTVNREIVGLGRSREYALSDVRNLRIAPRQLNLFDFWGTLQFWGFGGGVIAFDYGADTVRFAAVQEGEAEMILQRMGARYAFASGDHQGDRRRS